MLSDRIQASVVLCDQSCRILNMATWPRNLDPVIKKGVEELKELPPNQKSVKFASLPDGRLHRVSMHLEGRQDIELLVIKEGLQPSMELLMRVADIVHLGVTIWGEKNDEVATWELIHAIIQDDPIKMRKLANLFHIDIADIHEMWILHCPQEELERFRREGLAQVRGYLDSYCQTVIADVYEGYMVAFMDWIEQVPDRDEISSELWKQLRSLGYHPTLTRCGSLLDTADVRNAFMMHYNYLETACKIWPKEGCYTLAQIRFAKRCRDILVQGENALEEVLSLLTTNVVISAF